MVSSRNTAGLSSGERGTGAAAALDSSVFASIGFVDEDFFFTAKEV
jgi:hypothetical protein